VINKTWQENGLNRLVKPKKKTSNSTREYGVKIIEGTADQELVVRISRKK